MKKLALLFGLLAFAGVAAAQSVGIEVGKVLAIDREAKLLLLTDRSVWTLSTIRDEVIGELAAGDRVEMSYKKSDQGPPMIIQIDVTHHASETGSAESAEGAVLAFDRHANLLILEDKSVWPLADLQPGPPPGLGAGDKVRIEYHTDKDGKISVDDLIVTFK